MIAGREKGKKGTVAKAFPKMDKVIIDGVNMRKKHKKPTRNGEKGTTIEIAAPMHVSNVKLAEGKAKKATPVKAKAKKA